MIPDIPAQIKTAESEKLVLKVHADGVQIYVFQQGNWTLKAPEAQLTDEAGKVIGDHYAGPGWKHIDGSEVIAKPVSRANSPDPQAIPWVLLTAAGHSGNGVLSRVTSIQRVNTRGGLPPATAGKEGEEFRSKYSADYYFYAPAKAYH